jgi:hypothetical protein
MLKNDLKFILTINVFRKNYYITYAAVLIEF